MSEDNGQLVVSVPPIADDQLVMIAQRVEQRVAAYNKIRQAALKATNWRHWSNQGGQPYLEIAGSKSIASLVGISWKIDEPVLEWLEDGHFSYTYKGEFSLGATTQECIGVRSSKDAFFSTAKGSAIPATEIDRGEVKKAALTNCLGNGVRGILGMNKLTWDDLKVAGIDADKIGKVEYRQGNADPQASPILPNYGRHKGKAMDDPSVPIDELKYYLQGAEKSIADPEKKKYKTNNETMRDALKAEIAKREQASTTTQEKSAEPSTESPTEPSDSNKLSAYLMLLDSADSKDMLQDLWNTIAKEIKTELMETDQKKVGNHFFARKKEFEK